MISNRPLLPDDSVETAIEKLAGPVLAARNLCRDLLEGIQLAEKPGKPLQARYLLGVMDVYKIRGHRIQDFFEGVCMNVPDFATVMLYALDAKVMKAEEFNQALMARGVGFNTLLAMIRIQDRLQRRGYEF